MVMYVLWLLMCFLMGNLTGMLGRYLVASMALAASEAVSLGIFIGLLAGAALEAFYFLKVRDSD